MPSWELWSGITTLVLMVTRLPWMTNVDRSILEWLDENSIVFTPKVIYDNLERELPDMELPSYRQVSRRVKFLADEAGILTRYKGQRGKYMLSDIGRKYLDGELTDEERERLADLD